MSMNRRDVLLGTAAVSVAGSLAGRAGVVLAAAPSAKTYGMIEISASGITVSVYHLSREMLAGSSGASGFERLAPRRVGDAFSFLASPLRPGAEDSAAEETVELVAGLIKRLSDEQGIAPADVCVIASSGVASFSAPLIRIIDARLRARTGQHLDVITARDEARLTFDWVVAQRKRAEVALFDIGSGNLKGGIYDGSSRRAPFRDLSAPFGTKTTAGAVKLRWPDVRTFDFGARAAEFYADTIGPQMRPQIEATPALQRRQDVYLSGGIVWATAMILRPKQMAAKPVWLEMTRDDFAAVARLVADGTPYGVGLATDLNETERAWVTKTMKTVRNTFNPHQMAAGAALGDGLVRQLDPTGTKRFVFPTFANNAWSSQYLIERFELGKMRLAA